MASPYHHALSSTKKWGGTVSDYLHLHSWFDESKALLCDFRHRALRHHAQGVFELERTFGPTITLSTGKVIPTRWVGEQHVREDLGRIPSAADWIRAIRPAPWMGRATKLHLKDDPNAPPPANDNTPAVDDARVARAQAAMQAFADISNTARTDASSQIADLIGDLLHLAAYNGYGPAAIDGIIMLARTPLTPPDDAADGPSAVPAKPNQPQRKKAL